MIYGFIRDDRQRYRVEKMCQVLGVSSSAYYAWRARRPGKRQQENQMLLEKIYQIHQTVHGIYGSPRITRELQHQGLCCGQNRIARLMQSKGLRARSPRRWKKTTDSTCTRRIVPNYLKALAAVTRPNQVWVSDITYIATQEGWLYLAVVLDLYSRKVIGWCMQDRLTQDLVLRCCQQAFSRRNPSHGLIFHSDRGSQYASRSLQELLGAYPVIPSMSGRGNCYDNAVMESFFHSLKTEWVQFHTYKTRDQAKQSIFEYLEIFYNRVRRHSAIGYHSPTEYEQQRSTP